MRMVNAIVALALALCALPLAAGPSLAANVTVQVIQDDQPVPDLRVEAIASNGVFEDLTDAEGKVNLDLDTMYFRLRVDGELLPELHQVSDSPVVIHLD
jgi:hypothetical protein